MTADKPTRSPAAGGFLIASGVLGGAILGFVVGQPTIGLLTGLVLAIAVSIAMWLKDRG